MPAPPVVGQASTTLADMLSHGVAGTARAGRRQVLHVARRPPRWPYRKHRKRKRYHKEFDSTLGYPGEGPGLKLLGFNASGLLTPGRSEHFFSEANRISADVIFLQEHNHDKHQVERLARTAESHGFAPCLAPRDAASTRGGTGVLLRRTTFELGTARVPFTHHLIGRVTVTAVPYRGCLLYTSPSPRDS